LNETQIALAMKKIVRVVSIVLGVLLLLLLVLPFLFKSTISEFVKDQVNETVHATVDWDRIGLTFFRGFPDLSVNLHDVSVVGVEQFEGDTLVALNRFEFRVNPFGALRKRIEVKTILLDRPLINGIVLEDGTANWDIALPAEGSSAEEEEKIPEEAGDPEAKEQEKDTGEKQGSSMGISLKRFAISDGIITYSDAPGGLYASINDLDMEVRGDFALEQTDVELMLSFAGIDAVVGGIRYMKQGTVVLDIVAAADLVNNMYTLKKNEIHINDLVLGADGNVKMFDDGSMETDLRFFAKETSFATLLSMVPAIYLKDFESLETRGTLQLEGTVRGMMKDSILPDAMIDLAVSDGFFSYPDVPKDVSDVQIRLRVDYRGADMDQTTVNLEEFHLLLGGNPFDMKVSVAHPFTDMHVAGMVKGNIDFATLADVIPMEDVNLQGRLETDLAWDTRMSYIENEQFEQVDLEGRLMIEGVELEAPDLPVPVKLQRLDMNFTPRFVDLSTLDLVLGSSDLHMDGKLSNFIPYVFDGQTVSGSLNVTSVLLDANEFLVESPGDASPEETGEDPEMPAEEVAPPPPDSLAEPAQIKIPENIDFALSLGLKKVIYDSIVIENVNGSMVVNEGVARLNGLNLDVLEGTVGLDGTVDTRGEFTEADVQMDIRQINIPASYETFVTIERLAPVAQYCDGNANVTMDLRTLLDASFNPLYESIQANGHLFTRNLKVENTASLTRLSEALGNEKLSNLELEKLDLYFTIRDGRVIVDPFDINFGQSTTRVSGSHGIDMTMDYLLDMKIAKSDLGAGANQLMNNLGALAAGAGLSVPESDYINVAANITGTFKDPRVRTDLSGNFKSTGKVVREAVEERVKEEVEKVEEQVREEASERAEELIREAEAEKARLVEQARTAGERLVKEAEKQGAQLIEDAGSNPLKKLAAEKAAEKLVEEARKKSDRLVTEAETQGDALIQKAREKAAGIG
jgi:hypothetical protein